MLTLNPASLRAAPADLLVNGGGGTPALSSSADPAGFASLLRQTQMAPAPVLAPAPAPAPAASAPKPAAEKDATTEPVSPKESADEAAPSAESDTAQRARVLLKGRLRPADGSAVAPRDARPALDTRDARLPAASDGGEKTDGAEKPEGSEKADKSDKATIAADCRAPETQLTSGTTAVDPNVMQWLAGLQRAAAGQATEATPRPDGAAAPADTDTAALETRGAARSALAADQRAEIAAIKPPAAEVVATSPFAAVLVEQQKVVEKPPSRTTDAIKDLAAAGASAVAPAPTGGNDTAAPVSVPIATPVTAPDFAQELGLHLSTLAKDGVQTAELHLNPAEMGPVSVQIVMDGTQARVDFGADLATTRQAIEAGLPELASALADAGFTLAGGGVSQHAGGRSGGNGSGDSNSDGTPRRIALDDQLKRVATAARRIVTKGGIDLFA